MLQAAEASPSAPSSPVSSQNHSVRTMQPGAGISHGKGENHWGTLSTVLFLVSVPGSSRCKFTYSFPARRSVLLSFKPVSWCAQYFSFELLLSWIGNRKDILNILLIRRPVIQQYSSMSTSMAEARKAVCKSINHHRL